MYKVDLHTHSVASADGGLAPEQYAALLAAEVVDYIAITDHDRIDFAKGMQKALGDKIIVGQEITTADGDLVGLYLKEPIEPGMRAKQAAQAIHDQGGLVYVPHPFEAVRKGIQQETLDEIADLVDIVEICNGRALLPYKGRQAVVWAKTHQKAAASSSDAHGRKGVGTCYSILNEPPSRGGLIANLETQNLACRRAPLVSLLYPKYNKLLKKLRPTA